MSLLPNISAFLEKAAAAHFPAGDRKAHLDDEIARIREAMRHEPKPSFVFVCTHNSRRSHFARVWAEVVQYQLTEGSLPYRMESAGTEVTACNPRTVASLSRCGFDIAEPGDGENPRYRCRYADVDTVPPMQLWSKTLDDPAITQPLIAVMTCSDADQNCPIVPGALVRARVTYDDPKTSDDSPAEAQTYDTRSAQIAGEMHYIFSRLHR
ncbi:arsenate reductase [Cyclonatronum proteinivorum]|uniref:Arsenate reductase n=1 Tax=Cyclonatronum proteinivorum TaxID=1457365 RepID=A0A345UI89_9BACT|nr:protein-tyrosine-phosphatase [Cyclonatronum proteinivorum]AXJ00191.1 arsenate reductase [Cyclonatronum proteinivorum]